MESLYAEKLHESFSQTFNVILSFLDLNSLLSLLPVSTEFFEYTNSYFKFFLVTNKLIEHSLKPQPADYYYKLFRAFYSRDLLISPLPTEDISIDLKLVRNSRGSNLGIKNFDLGTKFAVFHLYNNDLVFCKIEEYHDSKYPFNVKVKTNTRSHVTKFFNRAKHLYYTNTKGELHVIFHDQNKESSELIESIVPITQTRKLREFNTGYKHGVLILEPDNVEKDKGEDLGGDQGHQGNEESKENKDEKNVKQEVLVYMIDDLTPENIGDKSKLIRTSGLGNENIISFVVGNTTAYFLNDKGGIFEMDLAEAHVTFFQAKVFRAMHSKNIKRLFGSYSFFFGLEQDFLQPITQWSKNQIIDWITKLGYGEYANIIKYENITGESLVVADEDYLENVMGVMRADLKVKILNEIQKVSKPTIKSARLLGWGNNNNGQLGHNNGNLNIGQPLEVPLPPFKGDIQIQDIICGVKQTIIMTKDELWMSIPFPKKPEKEKEPPVVDDTKKKKKKDKDHEEKEVKAPTPHGWFNITSMVQKADHRNYKFEAVSFSKDCVTILGSNQGSKKDIKIKRADNIIDRINWDETLDPKEFTVGYVDRFLGVLEIAFKDFTSKTDIPSHRVKFFKRNGEIVWDRTKKLNLL